MPYQPSMSCHNKSRPEMTYWTAGNVVATKLYAHAEESYPWVCISPGQLWIGNVQIWKCGVKCLDISIGNVKTCQEMSRKCRGDLFETRSYRPKQEIWLSWNGNVQTSISGLDISRNVKKCQEMSILKNANEIFNISGNVLVEYFQSINLVLLRNWYNLYNLD